MNYQVLARKWRPQIFSDVVGQTHVMTALKNSLSNVRLHHAYLFSGTRGVGKTSIARLLAKGFTCETGITPTPCGLCNNCKEIEQGCFVDLLEIDAASRTKVEDTRDLLYNMQYTPVRSRFKIYLIDEIHMLSRHSFNALLKTLEEPPSHIKFLLATTEPQKLPITILSRCLQFHLKALSIKQISGQLEKIVTAEGFNAEPYALQLLARASKGSMRDALSLTDQAIAMGTHQITTEHVNQILGTLDNEQPLSIIEALINADSKKIIYLIQQVAQLGVDWENLLIEILTLLHNISILQLLPDGFNNYDISIKQRLLILSRIVSSKDLQKFYQIILIGRKELPYAPDNRMGIEMILLRALSVHPNLDIVKPIVDNYQTISSHMLVPSNSCSDQKQNHTIETDLAIDKHKIPFSTESIMQKESLSKHSTTTILSDSMTQLLKARHQIHKKLNNINDPK